MWLADWPLSPMGGIGIHELDRNLYSARARFYFFEYELEVAEIPRLEHRLIAHFMATS